MAEVEVSGGGKFSSVKIFQSEAILSPSQIIDLRPGSSDTVGFITESIVPGRARLRRRGQVIVTVRLTKR